MRAGWAAGLLAGGVSARLLSRGRQAVSHQVQGHVQGMPVFGTHASCCQGRYQRACMSCGGANVDGDISQGWQQHLLGETLRLFDCKRTDPSRLCAAALVVAACAACRTLGELGRVRRRENMCMRNA